MKRRKRKDLEKNGEGGGGIEGAAIGHSVSASVMSPVEKRHGKRMPCRERERR